MDRPAGPEDIAADDPLAAPMQDAAARIDAARERLRATIQPRDDHGQDP